MSLTKYRILTAVIMAAVAASVVWAVLSANFWIPAPAIVAAIVIGIIIRRRVKELATDERTNTIAEKALAFANGIFLIVGAPVGITFIALGQEKLPELEPVGWTLTLAVCALVSLYFAANLYYNKKHSGEK
ncbi:MAG: DUF2178 domain-containing protein [Dehalococcoidia bacterium]|jgi:uncharacterized membrane protein